MPAVQTYSLLRNTIVHGVSGVFSCIVFFLGLFLFLLQPHQIQATEISALNKYISKGGYALQKNGKTVFSKNLQDRFIPASTIKLITSLAALKILGPDYRFSTRLFFARNSKTLYIQGGGDPYLISEKVREIVKHVAEKGITEIDNIVLDNSAFTLEHDKTKGTDDSKNPYNANCAALAVNFNTLPLKVINKAKVRSPERQTPYLPIMGQIGRNLTSGYHRVNINAYAVDGPLSSELLYCGQLFQTFLIQSGIRVTGKLLQDTVPPDTPLLYHYSAQESISDLVRACLLSSSNFMANQLYLAIGASQYGYPATWKKSQKAVNVFIQDSLQLTDGQITMIEGSGLSKRNRLSPEAMIRVLEDFKPFASLIPIKYGTRMKSGTLRKSGVFCYAGYIAKGKAKNAFVILLNQKKNGRDKILKVLYRQ